MNRPWAWAIAGGVAGVALQLQQPALWPWPYMAALLALGPLAAACSRRAGVWVLAGVLIGFNGTGLRAAARLADALDPALEGRELSVQGYVDSLPHRGAQGERFAFVITAARADGAPVVLPPRVWLGWYAAPSPDGETPAGRTAPPGLRAGERWAFDVRLQRPHGVFNAHGFDRERWFWEQDLHASGQVRTGARHAPPERLGDSWRAPVERLRQALRDRIEARVPDARTAGVLAALVVGDQAAVERDDWDLFRATGVAHLMSISGLHITLFAWLATAVLGAAWRAAGRRRPGWLMRWPVARVAAWGGLALATAYALLAGWGVPAQRTLLMLAVVVALRLAVRPWPWPAVWLVAMAAVLALDPWAWLSPGFWLSFVAVAILFSAGRRDAPGDAVLPGWKRGLRAAAGLWREQAVMTVALAPLGLWLFGQVSVVGLLANLGAIPWVTLVVTPLALAGAVWAPLWDAAAGAVQVLMHGLGVLGGLPWAVVYRPVVPLPLAVAAALGAWALVMPWPAPWRAAGALLCLPALLWSPPRPPPGEFEVIALDVGQGSAVLVRTAHHSLLVDAGPRWQGGDAGERTVLPQLRAWGEAPDGVIITHRDSDHAGGQAAIAAAFPSARWLSSFDPDPARRCLAGQHWDWDGVRVAVLHPEPGHYRADGTSAMSTNAMSCVLRIDGRTASAWLGGDLPAAQEVQLSLARPHERATLLLAPHHGSASSSSPVLLNTLQPRRVVVQAGHRNRFGHPAPVVVQRYAERGIPWVQTPDCGAATWRSAEPDAIDCERLRHRRYWHHPGNPNPAREDTTSGPLLAILPAGEKRP